MVRAHHVQRRACSTARSAAQHNTAQHSTAQHSAAQHSTAQRSTAQHSTAQHSSAQHSVSWLASGLTGGLAGWLAGWWAGGLAGWRAAGWRAGWMRKGPRTAMHSTAQHSAAQHKAGGLAGWRAGKQENSGQDDRCEHHSQRMSCVPRSEGARVASLRPQRANHLGGAGSPPPLRQGETIGVTMTYTGTVSASLAWTWVLYLQVFV